MSLKDALDTYKAVLKPNFRPEFGPIVGRTMAGLVASGQALTRRKLAHLTRPTE